MKKVCKTDYFEHKSEAEQERIINKADQFVVDIFRGEKILLSEPGIDNFLPFLDVIGNNENEEVLPFYAYVLNNCIEGNIRVYSSMEKKSCGVKERFFGSTLYRQFLKFPAFYFYYRFHSSQDIYNNYSEAMISAFSPARYEWDKLNTMYFDDFKDLMKEKIDLTLDPRAEEYFENLMFNIMLYADESIS